MIQIIKELDVEVTKPNIFQALVAKQYDMNTRFLKVTLKDCGSRIDVPNIETAKVIINAERKDGKSKGFDGVINEDGTVTVPLHSWMLELDGSVICDISVIDIAEGNNKKLTTTSFTLLVEKAAYGGDDVTSDPQYDVIVRMLDLCSEASTVAEDALVKSHEALEISAQANSKYDACVEATQNANAVREEIEAGGYIESLKEMNNGSTFRVWIGTQAEYDAIPEKLNNCLYCITDNATTSEVFERLDSLDHFINEVAEHATSIEQNCSLSYGVKEAPVFDEDKNEPYAGGTRYGVLDWNYIQYPTGLIDMCAKINVDMYSYGVDDFKVNYPFELKGILNATVTYEWWDGNNDIILSLNRPDFERMFVSTRSPETGFYSGAINIRILATLL